ncbi:MAG TPA: TerC family protein [Hyphomicrobiaceae bacterium]|nr:TerC family protein [Hyphomicrobiaceae bacterium]
MLETVFAWFAMNYVALFNVIAIDVVLAGDNAIVVGLAASQVAPHLRARVIFWGIAGAVVLRIIFAGLTSQLLQIIGLTLAGGLLLLWVCWKMYRQLQEHTKEPRPHSLGAAAVSDDRATVQTVSFWAALWQIIVADVSMSLDNVLAVAGAAKGSPLVLIIGLVVAIVLMAVASHFIAGLLVRYPWITWLGLAIILYVAVDMIHDGSFEIACKGYNVSCDTSLWSWATSSLFGSPK